MFLVMQPDNHLPQINSSPNISDDAASSSPAVDNSSEGISQLPPSVAPQGVSASTTQGLTADDVDLIEKEWVEKAKSIATQTQGDPYRQVQELNKIRADYIKKRYNKDMKLSKS